MEGDLFCLRGFRQGSGGGFLTSPDHPAASLSDRSVSRTSGSGFLTYACGGVRRRRHGWGFGSSDSCLGSSLASVVSPLFSRSHRNLLRAHGRGFPDSERGGPPSFPESQRSCFLGSWSVSVGCRCPPLSEEEMVVGVCAGVVVRMGLACPQKWINPRTWGLEEATRCRLALSKK